MPIETKIWDNSPKDGPVEVTMLSIHAREAIERDPLRYSAEKPSPRPKPAPAPEPVAAIEPPAPAPEPQPETPAPSDPDESSRKPKRTPKK